MQYKFAEKFTVESITTFETLFNHSISRFADNRLSWTYGSDFSYTYGQFGDACRRQSSFLSSHGIGRGDKVAIYSTSMPNWAMAFFTATAFGRVAVPILPDFSGPEAAHVLEHAGCKALYVAEKQYAKLSEEILSSIPMVISIETLQVLRDNTCKGCYKAAEAVNESINPDDLAVLIYTSGTTGSAKGVMLTHRNFMTNLEAAVDYYPIYEDDVFLSILPLAHAYELTIGMLYPFSQGSSVCYLSKMPTPSYLMKAMSDVGPSIMLSVPMIIEKVYRNTILPMFRKSALLAWMQQHMETVLYRLVGRKMIKTFGGRLRFFGIGGAKLDVEVEAFLQKARFPYHIGYGLTECAPLLCFCNYKNTVPGQIGTPIKGVEVKLADVNPESGEGEIIARGANIFPGYYLDPERTASAFTEDGWFRTGDLASVDSKGRFAIKGRIGNMIVGSSGENIYPEEIEKVVKQIPDIEDVIVICRGRCLVCLVKAADSLFDLSAAVTDEQTAAAIAKFKQSVQEYVNARVNVASRINSVEIMKRPFEKTATLKIKRFLYKEEAPTV